MFLEICRCLSAIPDDSLTIVLGDFNLPDINWFSMSSSSVVGSFFCSSLEKLNLLQLVSNPTHIKGNILDLVFTNDPDRPTDVVVHSASSLSLSDHHPILFGIKLCSSRGRSRPPRVLFNYDKADFVSISAYLDIAFAGTSSSSTFPLPLFHLLYSAISVACDLYIPRFKTSPRPSPPWFNPDIRHLFNKIHSQRRRFGKGRGGLPRLTRLESELQILLSSAKLSYQQLLVSQFYNQPMKLYNHLRKMSKAGSVPQTIVHNSVPIHDPAKKAELFNEYFHSVFTSSTCILPPVGDLPAPQRHFSEITISSDDVFSTLSSLETTKAPSCDDVSSLLLNQCAVSLASPISILFNNCIHSSTLPKLCKTRMIVPIYKKGDKTNAIGRFLCSVFYLKF